MSNRPTRILGISAYYHDSAAALICDGQVLAAVQEERFTRVKGDASFPAHAVNYCLETGGISADELDAVIYYEDPAIKFERLTTTYHLSAPRSLKSFLRAFPSWLTEKLWIDRVIARELGIKKQVICCSHHNAHAAAAFFPSPFEEAAVLTVDGVGEWATASIGHGRGNHLRLIKETRFPNSLGLLYSAFTYFTGFKINSGEYKLMGLAPYGAPRYESLIRDELVNISIDGSIQLNQTYFSYIDGLTMTNDAFARLFGGPPRQPESEITQREMDIAASIQAVLNDVMLRMARHAKEVTGATNLVLAGGVALNVVATGHLARSRMFDGIWIQPAAGDAGSALGAALWYWHSVMRSERTPNPTDSMSGSFLGPAILPICEQDDQTLARMGAKWTQYTDEALQEQIAELLAAGNVIGIARGRMEWGPRALGNRSILGDARSAKMQSHMNLKIKFRESFRPFAPMVLAEDAHAYFDMAQDSPYMLFAFPVTESQRIPLPLGDSAKWGIDLLHVSRSTIPAVTHVDHSARVQTVDSERHPFMHKVIQRFKERTGSSVIVNTSFNVRGEPIVLSAEDAFRCFMATDMDGVVIGNRLLLRSEQQDLPLDDAAREQWLKRFDLD